MKYKITDSKLESVIFLYLDNQDFIPIEKGDNIYFANSEGDEYSQIRYDKDDGWCYVHSKLVDEISRFFSFCSFSIFCFNFCLVSCNLSNKIILSFER